MRQFGELLDSLIAHYEAEEWENASCFVVRTHDPETGRDSFNGTFATPIEALHWAQKHDADLNADLPLGDPPCRVTVYPVEATG